MQMYYQSLLLQFLRTTFNNFTISNSLGFDWKIKRCSFLLSMGVSQCVYSSTTWWHNISDWITIKIIIAWFWVDGKKQLDMHPPQKPQGAGKTTYILKPHNIILSQWVQSCAYSMLLSISAGLLLAWWAIHTVLAKQIAYVIRVLNNLRPTLLMQWSPWNAFL